jgi:hypothetical protein
MIAPDRPTPHELLNLLQQEQPPSCGAQRLAQESDSLAAQLWRPFNQILHASQQDPLTFTLGVEHIYEASTTAQLLDHWDECVRTAADLRLPASATTTRL